MKALYEYFQQYSVGLEQFILDQAMYGGPHQETIQTLETQIMQVRLPHFQIPHLLFTIVLRFLSPFFCVVCGCVCVFFNERNYLSLISAPLRTPSGNDGERDQAESGCSQGHHVRRISGYRRRESTKSPGLDYLSRSQQRRGIFYRGPQSPASSRTMKDHYGSCILETISLLHSLFSLTCSFIIRCDVQRGRGEKGKERKIREKAAGSWMGI